MFSVILLLRICISSESRHLLRLLLLIKLLSQSKISFGRFPVTKPKTEKQGVRGIK